jgi:ATP-dependent helicase/nuclease subunit A
MSQNSNDRQLADQSARDRIVSDLERNLLVEAGAGSGKTHEMARRMAAGIATGVYQVEHMSAVTFTRKAAAELRGRFQLALEEELRQADPSGVRLQPDPVIANRIQHALSNLERFFAGTIHSFCAHLLRERPVEAGVSPGFTELDEVADTTLRKQSWRDFLTAAKADPIVRELRDAGIKPKDLDGAFETICLYEEVEFPPGDAARPDMAAGFKALDAFWATMQGKLPATIAPDTTCRTQKAARRFYGQMRIANSRRSKPGTLAGLLATWDFEPKITQDRWAVDRAAKKQIAAEIKKLHTDFRTNVVQPFLAAWRQYIYRLSITLLTTAREHAARERRRGNTLNYGDLLQLAARVLRGNPDVRRALQTKYRWLFVDEFQDTDPVQAEIIFLLAAGETNGSHARAAAPLTTGAQPFRPAVDPASGESGFGQTAPVGQRDAPRSVVSGFSRTLSEPIDWRTVPLRPGALFVVGDPKQSIYRFRRADIDIYNVVRDRLNDPRSGQVLSLTTNFRSVPALCEWANDVFRQQFPAEPTTYSPKFAPLDAHRAKQTRAGVHTLTIADLVDKADVPGAEADRIARFIRSEVDGKRRSFGDFLVLTRKRKNLAVYAEALEALQVPVEVSGAGAFGQSEEVAQLALLLRALSDPQDGVSLVGVLRGPLFGISDQDLFAFRQAGGWFSIFSGGDRTSTPDSSGSRLQPDVANTNSGGGQLQPDVGNTNSGSVRLQPDLSTTPVSAALTSLNQMFRWTRVLPAGAALERILEHTGYLALAATTSGGEEAGDLLHAIDRVRQVAEEGHSLAAAASALEDDGDASSEVESLPLEPGQSDVVRVMNLHKAKGLEAPVVFLADPCGGFKPRVDIRIIRDGLTARGYFRITSEWGQGEKVLGEPAGWDQFKQEEQTYLDAEEHRLLYVSATRARDVLVVGRWAKTGGNFVRAWEAFAPFLKGVPELPVPAKVSAPPAQPADLSAAANTQASATRDAAHARARVASWSATSVTAEARHIAKIARSAESDPDDPTRVVVADTPSHRADAGMAWGTLIHGLLEHAMRHKDATRDDLRRLAMWLTVEEPQLRTVIDEALQTVEAVAQADFWEKAKSSEHQVEVPFCVGAPTPTGEKGLTSGVVDLMHRVDDHWNVIDYKTDRSGLTSTTRYDAQLRAYREMWQKMTGCEVKTELVSTRLSPPEA